jgi:hypothetical protein
MHFDKLYPARFLKAGEFGGRDVTLTISAVSLEELEGETGKKMKAILTFVGTPKQLVLNKTNGLCIKAMFGSETDAWRGKRVTLFPANISFGDTDLAIRVRGSPDIKEPITFELKLPRKKGKNVTLARTGQANGKPASPAQPPAHSEEPPPPSDLDVPPPEEP